MHKASKQIVLFELYRTGNLNACCFVLVAGWDDFDDLISRKGQAGNVGGITSHKISVQDTKYAFMRNYQEIVLLALQFQDNRLESDC